MKIITSNCSHGAYFGVVDELKNNLNSGGVSTVIAPDRFTASVERAIIDTLGKDSSFGIEVMSFTRLANKLIGKDIMKCLTPEGSVMLIRKVINDCRGKLSYYGGAGGAEGFENELYAALTGIRNSGISTADINAAADKMPPALRAKMRDIVVIYEGYLAELEGRHSDSTTRLMALAEYLEKHPESVSSRRFYITDIYDFSAPELEIVAELAKSALSLAVGMVSGYDNLNKRVYPDRVIARLVSASRDRVQVVRHDEALRPEADMISRRLFSYEPPEKRVNNNGFVTLRKTADRRDEVLSLVSDIIKFVQGGDRYRDFEVYIANFSDYESELKSALLRYDIPFFMDKKELLGEQSKTRYILSALAVVNGKFSRREVLDFVKNPLFYERLDGKEEDAFKFENYVLKYNIDFSRFLSPFELSSQDKTRNLKFISKIDGDKTPDVKYSAENMIPEQVRKQFVSALGILSDTAAKDMQISELVKTCRKFLKECEPYWATQVEKISALSQYYKKCAEQVDKKLDDVLTEIEETLPMTATLAEFEKIFNAAIKTLRIALVPTYLDCVFIGDGDSNFMGRKHLYVLGATNDCLPSTPSGGAVLTPKDEDMLKACGVTIVPDSAQKALNNMYAIVDMFKKPKERLVISYPELCRPSAVISEILDMFEEDGKPISVERVDFEHLSRRTDGVQTAAALFSTAKGSFFETLKNMHTVSVEENGVYGAGYATMDEGDKLRLERELTSPERLPSSICAELVRSASVSRLETFFACPYAHYFQYILSLKKRDDGQFQGTENGIILHKVLELFFTDLKDGKISSKDEIPPKSAVYFDEAIKENNYQPLFEKSATARALLRLKKEAATVCTELYEFYLRSSFKPAMLEAKIEDNGAIKPITLNIDGKTIVLRGIIDRVDVDGDNFVIIDYKTYKSADMTYKEVYYGRKIQLLIYMNAVRDSLKLKPCGVFYLPIYASFNDEESARYTYKGVTTDDASVLERLDSEIFKPGSKSVVPFKVDKKTGALNSETHISDDDFQLLGDYVMKLAEDGERKILSGYIKPTPVKDMCPTCDYYSICRYSKTGERKLSMVNLATFKGGHSEQADDGN